MLHGFYIDGSTGTPRAGIHGLAGSCLDIQDVDSYPFVLNDSESGDLAHRRILGVFRGSNLKSDFLLNAVIAWLPATNLHVGCLINFTTIKSALPYI